MSHVAKAGSVDTEIATDRYWLTRLDIVCILEHIKANWNRLPPCAYIEGRSAYHELIALDIKCLRIVYKFITPVEGKAYNKSVALACLSINIS